MTEFTQPPSADDSASAFNAGLAKGEAAAASRAPATTSHNRNASAATDPSQPASGSPATDPK
jgi:hypothetical protein